jgi:hypothetical protein
MSDGAGALQTTASSEVRDIRIQRKWATLLRRADARESALRSALVHARTTETQLRLQLEGERRRHAHERHLLRDRLQRLEHCLLSYVATARGKLSAPLAATHAVGAHRLGAGAPQPGPVVNPELTAGAPGVQVPAPFDPVATVAALLPLSQAHAGAPEADVDGALDRLQTVVRGVVPLGPDVHPLTAPGAHAGGRPAQVEGRDDRAGREASPVLEGGLGSPETPWFPRAFRRLTEEDPTAAGRLFLQLLPAQGLVWPEDVAYRIEVAETGTLAVDVRAGHSTVRALLEPGPARAGEPVLRTDLAGLARAVGARRGWRVGARIAGTRNRHLRPLRSLAAAPLELGDLRRAGVQPDPALLLRLLALAIDPEWTAQELFTVACRWRGRSGGGCYIHVFERAPLAVTSAPPLGRVAATLTCEPRDLLDVLVGGLPLGGTHAPVSGDRTAVVKLLEWFQRVDATAITLPPQLAGVTA